MKTVAAIAGVSAVFSNSVLVGDVEAQTRWSVGSLVANLLSRSADPLCVILKDAGQGLINLAAYPLPMAGFDVLDFQTGAPDLILARGAGTSKSRPVIVEFPPNTTATAPVVEINGQPVNPDSAYDMTLSGLLANPPNPSFSALGILNRLEPLMDTLQPGWALVIDQANEKMILMLDIVNTVANSSLFSAFTAAALVPIAEYSLTLDETTETVPGFGWE